MTDTDDKPAAAAKAPPAPPQKMSYQQLIKWMVRRSEEDRAWALEQNSSQKKQIDAQTTMLAELVATQQKNQQEDRHHQRQTIDKLAALVEAAVGAKPPAADKGETSTSTAHRGEPAGGPAAARDGHDPDPDASDGTHTATAGDEGGEQAAEHGEADTAAGEEAHTEEADADEEVVEDDNGDEAEQDTNRSASEQNQETIVKPLRAIVQKLADIEKSLPDGGHATKENKDILDVLALIREATDKHTQWVSSLVGRLSHPAPPGGAAPKGEVTATERAILTVMGRLDHIVTMLNKRLPNAGTTPDEKPGDPKRPLAADVEAIQVTAQDLSQQLSTDRGNYRHLVWAGTGIAALAIPLALVLGLLVQQQFSPLAVPDPTLGWKDRVWASVGPTIAQCMSREDAGAGDCIVTITTPGE